MKHAITITFDSNDLRGVTDQHLAELWHVTQANPAPMEDADAGWAAEHVGREIIRRFLAATEPSLWSHQGRHAEWCALQALKEQTGNTVLRNAGEGGGV